MSYRSARSEAGAVGTLRRRNPASLVRRRDWNQARHPAPVSVHTLIVNGRVVVEAGELRTVNLEALLARHRRAAARLCDARRR